MAAPAPARPPHLNRLVPRKGLRWNFHHGHGIIEPERRCARLAWSLQLLVSQALPDVRMYSRPAKREVERLLVEIVDACAEIVRENPDMLEPEDFMAGIGMTGVGNVGWNPWGWEDESFLEQARVDTELGEQLSPHTFQALFLAIIEARQRFLRFAEENLSAPEGTLRRCHLAAAVDRFLNAALFWDVTSVPIQLQIEALDDEEVEDEEDEMYSTEDEEMEDEDENMEDEEEYEDMEE